MKRLLQAGTHRSPKVGMCAMEAAAWIAGEKHSDNPRCVAPTIANFCRKWNDSLRTDEERTRLLGPQLRTILGTKNGDAAELRRCEIVLDWLVREQTPRAFELVPSLIECAQTLRSLPKFTAVTVDEALNDLVEAQNAADTTASNATAASWRKETIETGIFFGVTKAVLDALSEAISGIVEATAYVASEDAILAAVAPNSSAARLSAIAHDAVWSVVKAAISDVGVNAGVNAWHTTLATAGYPDWTTARFKHRNIATAVVLAAVKDAADTHLRPFIESSQVSAGKLLKRMSAVHRMDIEIDNERLAMFKINTRKRQSHA